MGQIPMVVKPLLKPHLENLEQKMKPGMTILLWTSMNIDGYLHHIHSVSRSVTFPLVWPIAYAHPNSMQLFLPKAACLNSQQVVEACITTRQQKGVLGVPTCNEGTPARLNAVRPPGSDSLSATMQTNLQLYCSMALWTARNLAAFLAHVTMTKFCLKPASALEAGSPAACSDLLSRPNISTTEMFHLLVLWVMGVLASICTSITLSMTSSVMMCLRPIDARML